jgi:hypothetical protein
MTDPRAPKPASLEDQSPGAASGASSGGGSQGGTSSGANGYTYEDRLPKTAPAPTPQPAPPGISAFAHVMGWVGLIAFVLGFVWLFSTDTEPGRAWGLIVPAFAIIGFALTKGWRPFRRG